MTSMLIVNFLLTPLQSMCRYYTTILNKKKNGNTPHCVVCGDTEKDGKLHTVYGVEGSHINLCEDCFEIQNNMV